VPRTVFLDPPVLCGHRGSGRGVVDGHRENTLESFQAAVAAGVSWVEADARFNADGVLLVRHDPGADDGRYVSELTTEETDALGLLHLEDLLEALPHEVGVNVEIKSSLEDALRPRDQTTGALVADLVAAHRDRPLLVSSFDPAAVLIFRERLPDVPTGLLAWGAFPLRKAIPAAVHLGVDVVAPNVAAFVFERKDGGPVDREPAESVRVAHEAGLQVVAWCPKPAAVPDLVAAGVDCLIVDEVPAAVAAAA
jgi:glycerophosphoryl diester phosphodiesterase